MQLKWLYSNKDGKQPMDSMNTYATLTSPPPPPPQQQQQQPGILPQLPIPMTDFSNAVMHFISALNYRPVPATNYVVEQPLPPTPNDSTPLYTLSSLTAIQQPQDYPYLSYPMTASSGDTQNDKTEGDTIYNSVKQEEKPKDYQVPTCQLAEQMANHLSESTMTMNEERELGSISTMTSNNMAATTITDETTDFSQAFVKREFPNDTPFDRPILASATYPVLSPSQQQHQQQQVTEDSLPQQNVNQVHNPPRQVVVEPPRTPPRRQNVDPPRTPPPQNNNELLSQQTIPPPPRTPPHQIIEPSSTPPRKPNNSISITTGADVDPLRIPSTQHVAAVKPPTTPPRKSMTIPRPSTPPPIRKDTERNPSLSTPQKTVLNPPRTPPCQNMDHFSHSPSPKQQQKIPRPRTPPRPESKARRISPTKNTTSPPKDNSFVATSNMTETTALRQDDKVLVNIKKPKPSPDVQNAVLPMKITEPIKSDNSNTIKPPKTPPFKPKKIIQQDSIESNKMDKEAKRSTQPTTTKRVARPKTPPRHMHMDIDQGDGLVSNNNSVESDSKPILPVAPPKTPPRVPKKRLPDPPPFTLDKNTMESNFSRKKQIIDSSLNGGLVSPSQSSLHTTAGTSPPTPTHANTTRRRQSRWGIRGDS
ncbi:hypothetical protein BDA99DRAFT_12438 [Phascolomyces articulosus]|uniref:Uncharacterized protein n=1 Tax=Phascolomyces articulosus TaxID=60185 RepID=A0AAD5KS21_9FUNG|nr:hypothetical protein BDA99DRAFT_12438 [Phascolomyces articulosus]